MQIKERILKHIQYRPTDSGIHIEVRSAIQYVCYRKMYTSDQIDDILQLKIVPMLDFDTSTIHIVQTML